MSAVEFSAVVGPGDRPFVIVEEVPEAPVLPMVRSVSDDDLVVHAAILTGDAHRIAGRINDWPQELIVGLLCIQFNGAHSSVALIRATRAQIEKAKQEKRL